MGAQNLFQITSFSDAVIIYSSGFAVGASIAVILVFLDQLNKRASR